MKQRLRALHRILARHRRWVITAAVVVTLLALLRVLLPYAIEIRADHALAELDAISGTVGDVDLSLLRARGSIEQLLLENNDPPTGPEQGSAICPDIELEWSWWNLLRGRLVGSAVLLSPQILVAATPTGEVVERRTPPRADSGLLLSLPEVVPFTIETFAIEDGTLRYQDLTRSPLIDLSLTDLQLWVRDVTNLPTGPAVELPSELLLTATAPGDGELELRARFNPLAEAVRADLDVSLVGVDMRAINDLLIAYADLDVNRGQLHCFAELTIADGSYEGYLKVLMREVDVFSWRADSADGIFQKFWEALSGGVADILENQPRDQQAMIIPIQGDVSSAETDLSVAISTALSNAFIRAIRPGVEGRQAYEDVDEVARDDRAD